MSSAGPYVIPEPVYRTPEEEAEYFISSYNKHREAPELPSQLYQHMRLYSEQGKFDCLLQVLREFPEFRASRLFLVVQMSPCLQAAARAGHLPFLQFLLEDWGVFVDADPERDNLFVTACLNGHFEIMKYLYESYGLASNQEKLLLYSIKHCRIDILRYLHETIGIDCLQHKEKALANAFKSGDIRIIEYCFYELELTTINFAKTVETAVFAAATTGNVKVLEVLTDLFTVNVSIASLSPNRYLEKKRHLYHSVLLMVQRRQLLLVQYCVEVLKVTLASSDPQHEATQYIDLLSACIANADEDMLAYLTKDVGMSVEVFYQVTSVKLSEQVDKEWPDEDSEDRVVQWVEELESMTERSDTEELIVKRPRLNST